MAQLLQMNPDGTGQTEFYGNNSWFPTTLSHAQGIPGSHKVVAVAHGHHTWQAGELVTVDVTRGRQEAAGIQLIAPVRPTEAVRVIRSERSRPAVQVPIKVRRDLSRAYVHQAAPLLHLQTTRLVVDAFALLQEAALHDLALQTGIRVSASPEPAANSEQAHHADGQTGHLGELERRDIEAREASKEEAGHAYVQHPLYRSVRQA